MSYVRNSNGKWLNSDVFRESAITYNEKGYYTDSPEGSLSYRNYWEEERKRCIEGFSVDGWKITGDHYFYLNFTRIESVNAKDESNPFREYNFPAFWDSDYDYFWAREIARHGIVLKELTKRDIRNLTKRELEEERERVFQRLKLQCVIDKQYLNGGYNFIAGKARGKGFSFKVSGIACNNYFNRPNAVTSLLAYDESYLLHSKEALFPKALYTIGFIKRETAWKLGSDRIWQPASGHIRASYIEKDEYGMEYESGYMSEIICSASSVKEDISRGRRNYEVIIEEGGTYKRRNFLIKTYMAMLPTLYSGKHKTGFATLFGTAGEENSENAESNDFNEMFMNPLQYKFLPFVNTYDKGENLEYTGYFHSNAYSMDGFIDSQGNSDIKSATDFTESERRELAKNNSSSLVIQEKIRECPLTPLEAFGFDSSSIFATEEVHAQLQKVKAIGFSGKPVAFKWKDGKIEIKIILNPEREPITSYKRLPADLRSYPIIYEFPINNPPEGLYKIGYDPVHEDKGTSLVGILVFKTVHLHSHTKNILVAEYIGCGEKHTDNHYIAECFAEYYNCKIMYENNGALDVKDYFENKQKLHLLATEPRYTISQIVEKPSFNRVYGCNMNGPLKESAEKMVHDWLKESINIENDKLVTPVYYIQSQRLLEEFINYNRKGNFDLISALFMCMFYAKNEKQDVQQELKRKKITDQLKTFYSTQLYQR